MKTPSNNTARARSDGRKSQLVYLHPEVIKDLKKAALDEEKTAYEIAEEAISAWLANQKSILREERE